MNTISRRAFLAGVAGGAVGATVAGASLDASEGPSHRRLPRWRGFNLLEKFWVPGNRPFVERDFAWMAEWGFDFARLPLSYHCWAKPDDWYTLDEAELKEIDEAVAFGRKHGVHVCLNFHRAPGYCVGGEPEPVSLWDNEEAQRAFAFHWGHFAKRYQGMPNAAISFNLVNEPATVGIPVYVRVVERALEAIREHDPDRLVICDGLFWGREPVEALVPLGVAQSTRGYDPMPLTHYRASWVEGSDRWPLPAWPLRESDKVLWDKERLRDKRVRQWRALADEGVGVHVGECGAFRHTPHGVVLAWLRDCLELWKEAGFGWALWNLRGTFGILDSERDDVAYEDFNGHKLDRAMLELLQSM
ncbi:MAG TPA: cellulase family glycosylhydrolase [Candidatus Hydrogenedentes bacterium]|nr:cellulase family glycosylhydrolase [Candidatus Hydrogenedentota bacterium]